MFTHASLAVHKRWWILVPRPYTRREWCGQAWDGRHKIFINGRLRQRERCEHHAHLHRCACSVQRAVCARSSASCAHVHHVGCTYVRTQRTLHSAFAVELSWWQGLARFGAGAPIIGISGGGCMHVQHSLVLVLAPYGLQGWSGPQLPAAPGHVTHVMSCNDGPCDHLMSQNLHNVEISHCQPPRCREQLQSSSRRLPPTRRRSSNSRSIKRGFLPRLRCASLPHLPHDRHVVRMRRATCCDAAVWPWHVP